MGKSLRKYCICLPKTNSNEMKVFSILLLGLSNSGKTEIGHRIVGETRRDFALTNGVRRFNKNSRYILWNITEIGGSCDMQRLWHYYFVKAMGVIFTIDLSDLTNMPNGFKKLEEIVRHKFIQGKPILILLTKGDLVIGTNNNISDIEEFYNLENLANRYKSPMLLEEFSINDDTGFTKGIQWLDNYIETNYKALKNRIKFDSNIQNFSINNGVKNWFQRPHSAPSLRNAKTKLNKRRPRLRELTTCNVKPTSHQNGNLKISVIQNDDKNNEESNKDVVTNKSEVFGQKIENKLFKSNKVADINSVIKSN